MRAWLPLLTVACLPPAPGGDVTAVSDTDVASAETAAAPASDTAAPAPSTVLAPACTVTTSTRACPHQRLTLRTASVLEPDRDVLFALPQPGEGAAVPAAGWPVVVLFQGSFHPAARHWTADKDGPWGEWHQARTVEALLAAGFAVLTPEARSGGALYWDTNQAPWNVAWSTSPDAALIDALWAAMADGTFGPLDLDRVVVGGLSSGGYMASRLALARPTSLRGIVVTGASYATCAGPLCVVGPIGDNHPPALFLHGDADSVVPVSTMRPYARALREAGVDTRVVVAEGWGHGWLPRSPGEVVAWVASVTAP
jgi:pimeloyl-ACP methyl ester carboxylesterase